MSLFHSPRIITSGLIMCVDARNPKSYSGTGSTWFDISGNGNNLTLYNNPTFATNVFQFNGTTQYAENSLNLSTGTSTIIGAGRYTLASLRGRIITATSSNWLMGNWNATTENFYADGWVSSVGAGTGDTNWRIHAATNNVTSDSYALYVNGNLSVSNSNGTAGPNGISIARWGVNNTEYSACEVSFVLAYNRILTAAEIKQNFDAYRGRYAL